jgi:AraC-like DNA-binding protein
MQRELTATQRGAIYRDVRAIVEAEFHLDLRLDDVARRVAASRRQVQRCYAEIGNTTFRAHLGATRMQHAAELLASRSLTVSDVARRVNYPHAGQFAKAFRRHHGVTPRAFRAGARVRPAAGPGDCSSDTPDAIVAGAVNRRVRDLLHRCDIDRDGVLDATDFEEWVDRLGALRGWEPDDDGYAALTSLFVDRGYAGLQAARGRPDGRIALDAMRDGLIAMAEARPDRIVASAHALFDLIDADADGLIGLEEYRDLLASLSIARDAADAAFPRLDRLARGAVSRHDFSDLYLRFFTDDDPAAPAAWFWGPRTTVP